MNALSQILLFLGFPKSLSLETYAVGQLTARDHLDPAHRLSLTTDHTLTGVTLTCSLSMSSTIMLVLLKPDADQITRLNN